MTGSEKQIAWANSLKQKAIETMTMVVAQLKEEADAAQSADLDAAIAWCANHEEAKWWIDNMQPGAYVGSMLRRALKAIESPLLALIPEHSFCGTYTMSGNGHF